MHSADDDRRRHRRVPVSLLVQHRASLESPPETDYATDLSECGIFIRTHAPLTLGDTLQVTFAPQKDASLVEPYCRVARVCGDGVGAEFIMLDGGSAVLLARCLDA